MPFEFIFFCTLWISAISIIWFYTDWFIHYTQLFDIFEDFRKKYIDFIENNQEKYFPDFLHSLSLSEQSNCNFKRFAFKIASCPFCLLFWVSLLSCFAMNHPLCAAPVYVFSLILTLYVRKTFL